MVNVGFAPRSQWRDRAGFPPASLFGEDGIRPPRHPAPKGHLGRETICGWRRESSVADGVWTAGGLRTILAAGSHVRRVVLGIVVAVMAAGCRGADSATPEPGRLLVEPSPTPFTQVTAGAVTALVPDGWQPVATFGTAAGFSASPRPGDWGAMDGSVPGMSVTWVDSTAVGVPSDYYYLAATQPVLARLTGSSECFAVHRHVVVDHIPAWMAGDEGSAGDFLAIGRGICEVNGRPTRFAYYVAAPGFGPVHRIGIAESGLYVVVAMMPESRRAPEILRTLLRETRFGGVGLRDFIVAVRE